MKVGVYRVDWVESEAGMGIRPDGCSLHATEQEGLDYIERVMQRQYEFFRERYGNRTPPEYSRPADRYPQFVEVDQQTAERVDHERNVRLNKFEENQLFNN